MTSFKSFRAFLTGSYAYGYPGEESDIDLVVFVRPDELDLLSNLADVTSNAPEDENYVRAGGVSLRFGKLNLICVSNEKMYEVWLRGTKRLKKQKPVPRDFAIKFLRDMRKEAGFPVPDDEPPPRRRSREEDIPF